jgi:hypothetical protein
VLSKGCASMVGLSQFKQASQKWQALAISGIIEIQKTPTTYTRMHLRKRYLPLNKLQAGMVLARTMTVVDRGYVTYSLPANSILTEQTIEQLARHGAVCVQVSEPDTRTPGEISAFNDRQDGRLRMIFKPADLNESATRTLFDALLAYRSA